MSPFFLSRGQRTMVSLVCCNSDSAQTIVDLSCDIGGKAEQTAALCSTARETGATFVSTSRDIGGDLEQFGDAKKLLDPTVFVKLRDFVQKNQTRSAMEEIQGMGALAQQILEQAEKMDESLTKGLDSLPDDLTEEYANEPDDTTAGTSSSTPKQQSRSLGVGDEVDEEELEQLLNVDIDIAELENSATQTTRGGPGGEGLSLFSASTMGRSVFEGTAAKGERCQVLYDKMRELCGAVTNLTRVIVAENCCARWKAIASGLASLFRCRYLVALLRKVASAVLRLVKAIGELIQLVWDRVQGFLGEFDAAKKLGRFAKNKIKNSKVGKMATGLMSALDGRG